MTSAFAAARKSALAAVLLVLVAPACQPTAEPPPVPAQPGSTAPPTAVPELPVFAWTDCTFITRDAEGGAPELARSMPCAFSLAAGTTTALQSVFSSDPLRLEIQQRGGELRVRDETGLEGVGEAAQGDVQGCWRAVVGGEGEAEPDASSGSGLQTTAVEFDVRWCEGGDGMVIVRRARTPLGIRVLEVRAPGQGS